MSKAQQDQRTSDKAAEKLDHKKRKMIVNDLMMALSDKNPELYYHSTVEVAHFVWEAISNESAALSTEQKELVSHLSARDIQILLGHHSDTRDHLL